jgi:hypothetical protein
MAYTREYLEHFHRLPVFSKPSLPSSFEGPIPTEVVKYIEIEPLTDEWMEIWNSLSYSEQQRYLHDSVHYLIVHHPGYKK